MTDLPQLLAERLAPAFADVADRADADGSNRAVDPVVRRSDHADYQANGALGLAKRLRRNPREVAAEVLERADLSGLVEKAEIAGPGFINLTLSDQALGTVVAQMSADARLAVPLAEEPDRVVIDYSAPNVAKEMHVGHLRSTIIGDALVRVLEFLGHEVIRRNHLGDWGTPFGMLIEHLVDLGADEAAHELEVGDLTAFYQDARKKFDGEEEFATRSRRRVVLLQAGDEETLALWRLLVDESKRYFETVYDRLDVRLTAEDYWGESAYNDQLASVVEELTEKGLAVESEGALVTFPAGFTGREGKPTPLILRKSDGGFGYDVTDLAAIRHRARDLAGTRLVYVTDLGQRVHFEMIFRTAQEAGWLTEEQTAEFDGFGVVLGPDRKRLKTRSGDSPKLIELLDEAVRRADAVIEEKAPHLSGAEREAVARAVGIGAVKYADLSGDRVKDYVFDYDQMLSFEGNTAPYLQYAHARINSVFRKGEIDPAKVRGSRLRLEHPAEHQLALLLGEFEGAVVSAAETVQMHRIAGYLYDLATAFTAFYEKCPVLRAEDEEIRTSRLALCEITARVLSTGLGLLGITAPARM
ncbi:MAG TPA: arginine--tRNA ligase [Actinopolymorphaceae bacterium]